MDKLFGTLYGVRIKKLKRGGLEVIEVVGIVVGELYECFLVILFLSLTWFASASIQTITDDVKKYNRLFRSKNDPMPLKWQRSYGLILEFIEEVDSLFGPTLLILISKQILLFIVYFSLIYDLLVRNRPFPVFSVCYNIRNMFLLMTVVAGSQQMKNKVS